MFHEEKLEEFLNIGTYNKFKKDAKIQFKDGSYTDNWFINNRDVILNSDEGTCNLIKKQFYEYKKNSLSVIKKESDLSYKAMLAMIKKAEEFLNCDNLDKFNYNSSVTFKNGDKMYLWYLDNIITINTSQKEVFQKIRKQLEKRNELNKKRKILEYNKRRLYFYKENSLEKFNPKSSIVFKDGYRMGLWYKENRENISISNNPVDELIEEQKNLYYEYEWLKKEFMKCSSKEKFNSYGNERFKSGALMYFFFEVHKEDILLSNDEVSNLIKKQYYEYTDSLNNNKKVK